MSAKVKSWLLLAGIFVVGVVTGSALTFGFGSHFMHPPGAMEMRERWMMMLTKRLDLTPDQQTKIQPILADAENRILKMHHDEVLQGSDIIKSTNDQIAALLTPDQKMKLQQLETEREKMFSGHLHPWGPPHEGPGPGGGPDGMHHNWDNGASPPPPPPSPPPADSTNAPPPGPPPAPGA